MDYADPVLTRTVNERLVAASRDLGFEHHAVRIRNTGNRIIIDLHLLFPFQMLVGDAHRMATDLEQRLPSALRMPCEVVTHLESLEDHGVVHPDSILARPAQKSGRLPTKRPSQFVEQMDADRDVAVLADLEPRRGGPSGRGVAPGPNRSPSSD